MEEFEYSVEISDGDWQNFFAECEACNLLSPPLAHVDDSGMSDMDDMRSMLAKKAQIASGKEDFAEANNPQSCEGSPVEHFISKHGIGGFESVLSGSEEDVHLQSVNVFFESLRKVKKTDRFAQPCQKKTGKIRLPEQEQCSDGQKSISNTLPNKLNSRGEARSGLEDRKPVDMSSSINTRTKDVEHDSSMCPHLALSESVRRYNKPGHCETDLIIKKDASTETEACEATQWSCFHDHTLRDVCTGTISNTAKETKVQVFSPLMDKQKNHPLTPFTSTSNSCLPLNLQTPVLHFDTLNVQTFKSVQPELSPSASVKRKRRKKRRLSFEPPDSPQRCERRVLVWPSDSEEEQYTRRGRNTLGVPEDINLLYCREPQKNRESALLSLSSNLPVMTSTKDWSPTYVPENKPREENFKPTDLAETQNTTFTSANLSVDSVMPEANHSDEVATSLQESITVDKLTAHSKSAVSIKASTSCGGHQESDLGNEIVSSCDKEQNLPSCITEVKSITDSVPPCAQSDDSLVGSSQNDRLSEAKSVLAPEAGNCVGDNTTLCHRKAESQQQLKIPCCDADRFCLATEKKLQELKIKFCPPSLQEISRKVMELTLNSTNLSTKHCVVSNVNTNNTEQEAEILWGIQTKLTTLPLRACEDTLASETTNNLKEDEMSTSNDFTSLTDVTPLSSCCTLQTESVMSLSNENVTDLSSSFCSSVVCQNENGSQDPEHLLIQANQKDVVSNPEPTGEYELLNLSESKSEFLYEDIVTTSKDECEPTILTDTKHSVFAMSSFWSEMEKLTINDILGLRKMSKGTSPLSLPILQEAQEGEMFATTDSETLALLEESGAKHASPYFVETADFPTVIWESKPPSAVTDVYPEKSMLTCVSDTPEPVLSESAPNSPRRISKNISVQNLRALQSETFNSTWKDYTSQTFLIEESGNDKYKKMQKTDKIDSTPVSLIDSYKISITDIFQYFFGGQQSDPSQTSIDSLSNSDTEECSVPEMYDHFFSEFDTESFFYRPIAAENQAKDKQVPIFSCSRSASKDLHFPEAYDCFFPSSSSSSEESSESGEEDNRGPVKVVSRLSRKTSTSKPQTTDMYDNFYTDNDLKQNFFWNPTFSFRNIKYSGSKVQPQKTSNPLSCIPVMQSDKILQRTLYPTNVLGNHDMMMNRYQAQAQQPFSYEDFNTVVSNPRLDSSLLTLQQSDMCLVCIAFASWVLKTANPQVGDAWKAVLLANVSALSAIRYLRKYVRTKAEADETRHSDTDPSQC